MDIDVKHACSFTGHRPERLNVREKIVKDWLEKEIDTAISERYTDFISGMQRGVDIWAAEIVLERKKAGKKVRLIAACAFKGMEKQWQESWIARYNNILKEADDVRYIGRIPSKESFFKRNERMVDNSSRLIGVFTGAPGGTRKTINYAKSMGKEVMLFN